MSGKVNFLFRVCDDPFIRTNAAVYNVLCLFTLLGSYSHF